MNDQQLVAIAITLFAVASGAFFNNLRISDSNQAFNKRMDDLRALVNQRIDSLQAHTDLRFDNLDAKLDRIADTLTAVISDHEKRIRDLEHKA